MGFLDRLTGRLERLVDDVVVPEEARAAATDGERLLERGDLDGARRQLERALALAPDYLRAWFLIGLCHARRGETSQAAAALERAAGTADHPEALVALAEVHRDAGHLEEAHRALQRALTSAPSRPEAVTEIYRALGELYLHEGAYDKAVRDLRKAVAAAPDDPGALALLGEAHLRGGDRGRARLALERAARAPGAAAATLVALGEVDLPERADEAAQAFRRALERDSSAAALTGLARAESLRGDHPAALDAALRALAETPQSATAHALVALIHRRARSFDAALAALDHALAAPDATTAVVPDAGPLLPFALATAVAAGDHQRSDRYAARLLELHPRHAAALAARGVAALAQGDEAAGLELCRRSLEEEDNLPARVGLGEAALRRGDAITAGTELRAALRLAPDAEQPRQLLRRAYQHEALPHETRDLYLLLRRLHDHLLRHREIGDLAPAVARLVEVFDRPLVVTVMGEFSSGKSTFVNALLGDEVAPMGITPTTATINLLKYGPQRLGRVIYGDDRVREVPWHEMTTLLRDLDQRQARSIRLVEVLSPLETLARVNIVDTPGLNSIMPEHERVARDFIASADAVVWLFAAGQAGKETERQALAAIAGEQKKILGVVNKIDRLSPDEEQEVVAHLTRSCGDYLEALVPFSAREALVARTTGDDARLDDARYPQLMRVLEERFYSRGRALKRHSCLARTRAVLHQCQERAATATARLDDALSRLEEAREHVAAEQRRFTSSFLSRERLALARDAEEGHHRAAREILDFVRPRRWPFGSHQAAPADRDFLLELLDEQTEQLVARAEARAVTALAPAHERTEEVVRAVAETTGAEPRGGAPQEPAAALQATLFERYRAFVRGYQRGGRVDHFFTRDLPRLELSEETLAQALLRDAVDLDAEIVEPLGRFGEQRFTDLQERLAGLTTEVRLLRFDLEARVFAPLVAFGAALAEAT